MPICSLRERLARCPGTEKERRVARAGENHPLSSRCHPWGLRSSSSRRDRHPALQSGQGLPFHPLTALWASSLVRERCARALLHSPQTGGTVISSLLG